MVETMNYSIGTVELDEAVEVLNSIQSPTRSSSQSKAIQDRLRRREELREKLRASDEQKAEEMGFVHRGTQVGESKVCYKRNTSVSVETPNGIYSLMNSTRAQEIAKKMNQVEPISQKPSVGKTLASLSNRRFRRVAPSEGIKLYEDSREDLTLQWTIPNDLYADNLNSGSDLLGDGRKSHFTWRQLLFYNLQIAWRRYVSRSLDRIPFLRTQIRKIEGNFGVGIASFFVFARLVIALNIVLAVLWTCFVILPVAIMYNPSDIVTAEVNKAFDIDNSFHVRNLFDGRGPVADSWLFFGGYVRDSFCESNSSWESKCNCGSCTCKSNCESNSCCTSNNNCESDGCCKCESNGNCRSNSSCVTTTGACDYSSCSYRIDIAYMIMIFVSLFGPFFILSWNYSESLSNSGSRTGESDLVPFSIMVLTSWDHSLVSGEAVGNLSKGITNTLKDKLTEYRNAEKKKIQTKRERAKLVLRRIAAWLIAILLIASAIGSIVLVIIFGPVIKESTEDNNLLQALGEYFELYGSSVLFVIINALVPNLMFLLLPFEKYDSGKTEFNVTITRVFLVRILNLYALMAGWKISTDCRKTEIEGNCTSIQNDCRLEVDVVCAGTYYGQELYKVTLLSIAATIFGQLILRFVYFYWFNKKREFLVADAVLAIVYIQSVVWAGTAVCPFLPLIAAIGLLCLFFAYYYIVQYTCHPPIKRWSQSRQNSFFLFSLLAALICVIIPVSITVQTGHVPLGTVIFSNKTSPFDEDLYCGPFRNRTALFAVLPDTSNGCGVFCELFYVIFSSAIGLPLIFCLMVALLQFSIRLSRAKKKYNLLLKELEMERENLKIVLKDYHRLEFDLKQERENRGHQSTDVASLARGTSRVSLDLSTRL